MREKITKAILAHLDGEMRVINLQAMVDDILDTVNPNIPWSEVDPKKWGELTTDPLFAGAPITGRSVSGIQILDENPEYVNEVFPPGHWEHDDAGYMIWVDDTPAEGGDLR